MACISYILNFQIHTKLLQIVMIVICNSYDA